MKKKKTLLEQAKEVHAINRKREFNEEEFEVVCAWIKGEIQTKQLSQVLALGSIHSGASRVPYILRKAYSLGRFKISKK